MPILLILLVCEDAFVDRLVANGAGRGVVTTELTYSTRTRSDALVPAATAGWTEMSASVVMDCVATVKRKAACNLLYHLLECTTEVWKTPVIKVPTCRFRVQFPRRITLLFFRRPQKIFSTRSNLKSITTFAILVSASGRSFSFLFRNNFDSNQPGKGKPSPITHHPNVK